MASISAPALLPSIMDVRAFYRAMNDMAEAKQARLQNICPSLPPSGFDPNLAEDYWQFLSRGRNIDVSM